MILIIEILCSKRVLFMFQTCSKRVPDMFARTITCTHENHPALLGYTRMWVQISLMLFLKFSGGCFAPPRSLLETVSPLPKGGLPVPRNVKAFDELRIRNFPYDKKVRLVQKAAAEKKSLQEFLYDVLMKAADNEEVMDVQYQMVQTQKETNTIVEQNTKVLLEVKNLINYISGGD